MAVKQADYIPNHDREAVSEALEAALLCAAFQRMEESEMKRLISDIRESGKCPEASAKMRRRLNRHRGWTALQRAMPRAERTNAGSSGPAAAPSSVPRDQPIHGAIINPYK